MGRKPRIEYAGAVYHVMCRGNKQEPVFEDDQDCKMFLDVLGVTCERTGWLIHAYVLMGNHYHLLIETPEANLVSGMRWIQGTYTKRFNARHHQWGHLFQGRYKALLVDSEGDYFSVVSNYIHLNPARSKMFDLKNGKLTDYKWSSYPFYVRTAKRPAWLVVDRTLGNMHLEDNISGRIRYRNILQKRVQEIAYSDKPWEIDEDWNKIRRGWYFGSSEFRDELIGALDGVMIGKRRDSFGGTESIRHDELEAQRLLMKGMEKLSLDVTELPKLKKGDVHKKVLAWYIRKNTSVRNEWISQKLHMGCLSNISHYVSEIEQTKDRRLCRMKKILK